MKIYYIDTRKMMNDLDNYSDLVMNDVREEVDRCSNLSIKSHMIFSNILLRFVVNREKNIPLEDIEIYTNQFGKKYLKNTSNFYFNISHSGDFIVLACDVSEIGIDIEKKTDCSVLESQLHNKVLSKKEIKEFIRLKEEDKLDYFYRSWTIKEAYLKFVGTGILDVSQLSLIDSKYLSNLNAQFKSYLYFEHISIDENYCLSICSLSPVLSECNYVSEKNIINLWKNKFENK